MNWDNDTTLELSVVGTLKYLLSEDGSAESSSQESADPRKNEEREIFRSSGDSAKLEAYRDSNDKPIAALAKNKS